MESVRKNFAEGRFYSHNKEELIQTIENSLKQESSKIDLSLAQKTIIGGVVPHAAHIYCSSEAVHFFKIVSESKQKFDVVIVINPNHHRLGSPLSIDDHAYWQSPLGKIKIDRELAEATNLPMDVISQSQEHSGEVMVPYIQYFLGNDIELLPINFGAQSCHNAEVLAMIITEACKKVNKTPLIVASSDFNHFASASVGRELDNYALQALLNHDLELFEKRIQEKNISICGYGAILSLFFYAKINFKNFHSVVLRQGHSGEVFPSSQVVDYVSLLLYE